MAYDAARQSGNQQDLNRYRWTLEAAKATVSIWCGGSDDSNPK